jgi:capsular exopolysaccharide synthesis family protein
MKNPESNTEHNKITNSELGFGLDPQVIIKLIIKYWYIYILSIGVAFLCARVYITHTMPVYLSSTTILVNEVGGERTIASNEDLLQGLGLSGGMRNLENQIMILRSRALTEQALKALPFDVEFYQKTFRNKIPLYPVYPVKIFLDGDASLPKDTEFTIEIGFDNSYIIKSGSSNHEFFKSAVFGENIEIPGGSFRVDIRDSAWIKSNIGREFNFIINSPQKLVNNFNSRLEVELLSRTGSILKVSLSGTNPSKDVDFLNMLSEVFQSISLDKKNNEAIRRIQFIDDQLIGISDSLQITENKLQQFRQSHKVMDLSAQGQAIIEQVTILENEKARLNLEANYYDYLADYLAKDVTGELPIVPITMGITDPGLTRLVTELADLQSQLSSKRTGELNPLQNLLNQRVSSTKDALLETLNGLRRANSLARSENQDQINRVNSQASALPVTERQLLGIERKFRLNNEMYTFLLQTRAEQQMQKASNTADSEVVDPADTRYSSLVSPKRNMIYLLSLFFGFGIPMLSLFFNFIFNKKLREEDIPKLTLVPVLGSVPHAQDKYNKIVIDFPNSSIAEAFRLMRSKMEFFTKDSSSPVILVTSSMPEEGKTFIAINLASVYSMLGKKTVLVGYDLRKPKIHIDFNIKNDKGVTTFLIGKNTINEIIQETSYENLSVIPSGPVPPNPAELTALGKTIELIRLLRDCYDIIIIDSSPIGLVSDTFSLLTNADACMLVVRPGTTIKNVLESTLMEIGVNSTKSTSLIINDIKAANKFYRYGHKYGYINDELYEKRSFWKNLIKIRSKQ